MIFVLNFLCLFKTSAQTTENLNTTDRVKQGFHSLMSGITKVLTVDPEDTSPPSQPVSQPGTGIFDRAKVCTKSPYACLKNGNLYITYSVLVLL